MSFLNNIIQRYINPANQVQPRLKGIFEQENSISDLQENFITNTKSADNVQKNQMFSDEKEINFPDLSRPNSKHEILEESAKIADNEIEDNDSTTINSGNKFPNVQSMETLKNYVSPNNQSSRSNFLSTEKEFGNEHLQNDGFSAISKNEKEGFQSSTTNITPFSAKVLENNEPSDNSKSSVKDFLVSQHNQSNMTFNLAQNIKTMINAETVKEEVHRQSVIKVNIGRIDVRAIGQQFPVKTRSEPNTVMTLDDFLKNKKVNS